MIVSHKYKFVFIKTTKTAGTSIEIELAKLVGDGDIVTPIKPPVEGHCARNYRMRDRLLFTKEFYNHMPARLVRDYLGARRFDDYFKFCVEREPVEKCVSHFSMLKNSPDHGQGMKRLTWDQYVSNGEFPVDIDKYTDAGGSLIVDRIIRYENLDREMAEMAQILGFNLARVGAKAKSGFRETIDVTQAQKARIYEAFAESNRFSGYSL